MCIDTVSLPNVSRFDDISIYRCISSNCTMPFSSMINNWPSSYICQRNLRILENFVLQQFFLCTESCGTVSQLLFILL